MPAEPTLAADLEDQSPAQNLSEISTPPLGCPPPLHCREVAAAMEQFASPWELPGSRLGMHGWCWGTGRPVYLLPSMIGSSRLMALLSWLMREDRRCVIVDWSPPILSARATLDDFAEDLQKLVESAGDVGAECYASSFGAAVAIRAAARAPSAFSRMVLQGVQRQQRLSLFERALASWFHRSARPVGTFSGYQSIATLNHRRWFPPLDVDRWQWFLETTGAVPRSWVMTQARAWDRVNLSDDLQQLEFPVLLINAEGTGPKTTAEQEQVLRLLPQGRSTPMHTTGWHTYLTHPHRLKKLLDQFDEDPTSFDTKSAEPETLPLPARTLHEPTPPKTTRET